MEAGTCSKCGISLDNNSKINEIILFMDSKKDPGHLYHCLSGEKWEKYNAEIIICKNCRTENRLF